LRGHIGHKIADHNGGYLRADVNRQVTECYAPMRSGRGDTCLAGWL